MRPSIASAVGVRFNISSSVALQILHQHPRVSSTSFIFRSAGRWQNFWSRFGKTALLLEINESLSGKREQPSKSSFTRQFFDKRHQASAQSLILARATDVKARKLGHALLRIGVHGDATDDPAIDL